MKNTSQRFRLNPSWTLSLSDNGISVSGGEDSLYQLECPGGIASALLSLTSSPFTRSMLPPGSEAIFAQLVSAEVFIPIRKKSKTTQLHVAIKSDDSELSAVLGRHFSRNGFIINASRAEIAVLIRTQTTLGDFLQSIDYASLAIPHVFVDLAFNHTVSLGPLVFPGETPCVACLEGRLKTRWGDPAPPKTPAASTKYRGIAAELACLEMERFRDNDTSLTFKTVAYDLAARTTTVNKLLTVPQCPYYSSDIAYASGKLLYNTSQ